MNYYYEKSLKEKMAERDMEILAMIKRCIKVNRTSPTVREIAEAMGFKSSSTALQYLRRLQKQGYVDWKPRRPRTLRIIDSEQESAV